VNRIIGHLGAHLEGYFEGRVLRISPAEESLRDLASVRWLDLPASGADPKVRYSGSCGRRVLCTRDRWDTVHLIVLRDRVVSMRSQINRRSASDAIPSHPG